ncbi:MAG: NAD(P)/FAD-dependent oxidoreductase [Myxococcota bacterium]
MALTTEQLFWNEKSTNPGPAFLTEASPAAKRYQKPTKLLENPDAIVIGTGIGGLSIASALAQKRGMRVLMLETSSTPGGCTHCHELGGFEFNSGVDSIGDMDPRVGRGLYRPTIDFITGGKLQWAKMPDVHETAIFGDKEYKWYSSPEANIDWVEKEFPGEGDIRAYYELEEKVEWWAWSWAITKLAPNWLPEAMREGFYSTMGGAWRKYMGRTTNEVFRKELGFSERLAAIYSYMYGNHGRTPEHAPFAFHAVNLFHYRDGAYYPVGGPGQIANCIVPIVESAGGQLAVSSNVERILVENGKAVGVRLADGQEVRSKLVISDASAYVTFMELLEPELSQKLGYPELFKDIGPSPAHLYLLLGYDEAIDLPKHIIWHMPEYEGVNPYDLSKADAIYKDTMRLEGMGGYLLSPSARDPVYAQRYPNKSTVIVLAEAPPAWVEKYKKDPSFRETFQAGVTENLMRLVKRHMPQLNGKTPAFLKAGVPMGCNPRAWAGCSLGLEPSGERFVKHTHWLKPKTPIDGLWLTGQDAFSAGFCGAMLGGRLTYSAITGDWLFMLDHRL